jgi:hypothetical protein
MKGLSMNTLGNQIGIVESSFSITNSNDDKVDLRIKFDFRSTSDEKIKALLTGQGCVVAFQNGGGRRGMSAAALRELDGMTVLAHQAGCKVRTKAQQVEDYVNAGIPAHVAKFMVENPDKLGDITVPKVQDETEAN